MSDNNVNLGTGSSAKQNPNFAPKFGLSGAAAVISLMLVLNTLYMKIGQMDNSLAQLNSESSMNEANLASMYQKQQGQAQKMQQIMQATGTLGQSAVTFGGMAADLGYTKMAGSTLSSAEAYTSFGGKALETKFSTADEVEMDDLNKKVDLEDPHVKARIEHLKSNFDFENDALEHKTGNLTDNEILTHLKDNDPEAFEKVKAGIQTRMDNYMKEVEGKSERIRYITQAAGEASTGAFNFAAAGYSESAANAQGNATILQNLMTQANQIFSSLQGKSSSEFEQMAQVNQILEQLIQSNQFRG